MRLYNEDCLAVLDNMESDSVDCIVSDIPYTIISGGCTTGAYGNRKRGKKGVYINEGSKHVSLCGVLDDSETYMKNGKMFKKNDIQFSDWMPYLYKVLKNGCHCYLMVTPRHIKELQEEAEKAGFVYQQMIVWDKGTNTPNRYYLNSYELILMLRKGAARSINNMGTKNILRVKAKVGGRLHPTEKPVELMKILVENSTNIGDTVLDPFMGSGATGVACKESERDFIGIEIDEKYYNIAKERLG